VLTVLGSGSGGVDGVAIEDNLLHKPSDLRLDGLDYKE